MTPLTVLRIPAAGGTAIAYLPDRLALAGWHSMARWPPLARVLGFDHDQRLLYALDSRRRLVWLDLETGGGRVFLAGIAAATVGPDGAVYAVDSTGVLRRLLRRATTTFQARFDGTRVALFGAANGQVVAIGLDSSPTAQLLSSERAGMPFLLPGREVTVTQWGELLAAADDAKVRLVRTADGRTVGEIRVTDPARQLLFSPSGHRLYVLETDGDLTVIDRFAGTRLRTRSLPGPAVELRGDPSGRWLLARHQTADSVWVLDLVTEGPIRSIPTRWREDLPLLAGATLLVLVGQDVEAWDLRRSPPAPVARAPAGSNDLWVAVHWLPPGANRERPVGPQPVTAGELGLREPAGSAGSGLEFWLQVSSSQNPDWATALADQLFVDGFPATVWKPQGPDESYRVVVGPYASREEAEQAGRRLELPFFVIPGPRRP